MPQSSADLTPKARRTRQHLLDTALALFAEKGYDATTMRDIARTADCSLGLIYRYYERKEDLVLAFYWQMAAETAAIVAALDGGTMAERFAQVMRTRLEQAAPYRDMLGALFGVVVNPASGISVLDDKAGGTRSQAHRAFAALVSAAEDAPAGPRAEHLATLLYSAHFGVLLFWLQDRTPDQGATNDLLTLMQEALTLLRPLLMLPPATSALARLAGIMEKVFIGEG